MVDQNILAQFMTGYLEAMFFTEGEELDGLSVEDMSKELTQQSNDDCKGFIMRFPATLPILEREHNYSYQQAGRDFWYTRNGHGVGFWDRGLPEEYVSLLDGAVGHGARYPQVDIYKGDNGLIYGM